MDLCARWKIRFLLSGEKKVREMESFCLLCYTRPACIGIVVLGMLFMLRFLFTYAELLFG